MASTLDANLLKLFAPRPPLDFKQPVDRPPAARKLPPIHGIAQYLDRVDNHDADYVPSETKEEKKKRIIGEIKRKGEEAIATGLTTWNPNADPQVKSDPYKTLFVGRLAYGVTEKQLRREFDRFGPIVSMRIVTNTPNALKNPSKPRGYAFIEYERERDLTIAYREADGIKIEGRRIVVDVERGRTVKGWRPRRLGGGLGGTRLGGNDVNIKVSGRDGGNVTAGASSVSAGGHQGGGYGNHQHARRKSPSVSFMRQSSHSPVKHRHSSFSRRDDFYQQQQQQHLYGCDAAGLELGSSFSRRNHLNSQYGSSGVWNGISSSSSVGAGTSNNMPRIFCSSGSSSNGGPPGIIAQSAGTTPTTRKQPTDFFSPTTNTTTPASNRMSLSSTLTPLNPTNPLFRPQQDIDAESGEIPLLASFGTDDDFVFSAGATAGDDEYYADADDDEDDSTRAPRGRKVSRRVKAGNGAGGTATHHNHAHHAHYSSFHKHRSGSLSSAPPIKFVGGGDQVIQGGGGGKDGSAFQRQLQKQQQQQQQKQQQSMKEGGGGGVNVAVSSVLESAAKTKGFSGIGLGAWEMEDDDNEIASAVTATVVGSKRDQIGYEEEDESMGIHDALKQVPFQFGSVGDSPVFGGAVGAAPNGKGRGGFGLGIGIYSSSGLDPFASYPRTNPDHGKVILYSPLAPTFPTSSKHHFTFTFSRDSVTSPVTPTTTPTITDSMMTSLTLPPPSATTNSNKPLSYTATSASFGGSNVAPGTPPPPREETTIITTTTTTTTTTMSANSSPALPPTASSSTTRRHHSPNRHHNPRESGNDACDEQSVVGIDRNSPRNSPRTVHRVHHLAAVGASSSLSSLLKGGFGGGGSGVSGGNGGGGQMDLD